MTDKDDDLIRRGDALAIVGPMQWSNSPIAAMAGCDAYKAIAALPAMQPAPDAAPLSPTAVDASTEAETDAKVSALVDAAKALRADMLERAELKIDQIRGAQYRIVNAGNTAWSDFCAALAALEGRGNE